MEELILTVAPWLRDLGYRVYPISPACSMGPFPSSFLHSVLATSKSSRFCLYLFPACLCTTEILRAIRVLPRLLQAQDRGGTENGQ